MTLGDEVTNLQHRVKRLEAHLNLPANRWQAVENGSAEAYICVDLTRDHLRRYGGFANFKIVRATGSLPISLSYPQLRGLRDFLNQADLSDV